MDFLSAYSFKYIFTFLFKIKESLKRIATCSRQADKLIFTIFRFLITIIFLI